jgi:hypothetical protein
MEEWLSRDMAEVRHVGTLEATTAEATMTRKRVAVVEPTINIETALRGDYE